MSLSQSCREAGVTRPTGRKWVNRALEEGLAGLKEQSRAPKNVANRTDFKLEEALVAMKARYPEWGARKLVPLLKAEGVELAERTAEHILKRKGLSVSRPAPNEPVRFERESCGSLLQMDFKGQPVTAKHSLLTVIDDYSRFCLAFEPVKDKTGPSVQAALWEIFGTYGLPESMLMDNGDCWGSTSSKSPTAFEAWLMRLGIKPIHGKPHHPQTQGKVERFHKTAKLEVGRNLFQDELKDSQIACRQFVERYNCIRPHDALGGKVPASLYFPSSKKRPAKAPLQPDIPSGALTRRVDGCGFLYWKGKELKLGKGLIGQRVALQEDDLGMRIFYAGFPLAYIYELDSRTRQRI